MDADGSTRVDFATLRIRIEDHERRLRDLEGPAARDLERITAFVRKEFQGAFPPQVQPVDAVVELLARLKDLLR